MSERRVSATLDTEQDMPTGLIRRNGRYSTRRVIPLDLQPLYGSREIVRALRTSDPAQARRAHARLWLDLEIEFDEKRKAAGLDRPDQAEPEGYVRPLSEISPTIIGLVQVDKLREQRDEAVRTGTLSTFMRLQRDALTLVQAMLDGEAGPTHDFRELEGMRNGLRAFLTGEGSFAIAAARKARSSIAGTQEAASRSDTLSSVVDRWARERKPTERTVRRTRNIVARFEAVNGSLPVQAITKHHVLAFKDALVAEGQTAANVNVMIPMLGTMFNYASDKLHLIDRNPAAKINVSDKRRAKDKRRAFTEAELTRIFLSPVYSQSLRPDAGGGEAAYWLPLLALYTGGRQTELGQLHPEDVAEEPYIDASGASRSAWVLRIVENPDRNQWVKNEGSERRVPLHPDLLGLGFLDVVRDAQATKRDRIFSEIVPAASGELMGNWSKWFGRYRRKHCGLPGRETPFHSFRHTFKHLARLASIPNDVHNELTGHETGDVADDYGGLSYPLSPLVDAISRYRVPNLVLPCRSPGLPAVARS